MKASNKREKGAPVIQRRYFNREINWLEFNLRVLQEGMDSSHPLLERVKFLGIFFSNLDEFYMIRVSGLMEQVESGLLEPSEDGLTAPEQLLVVRERAQALVDMAERYFQEQLLPELRAAGICLHDYRSLSKKQRASLRRFFMTAVYPVLTPLAVDPGHPFPHISNLSLSLAVVIRDPTGEEKFARVKIPQQIPRLLPVDACEAEDFVNDESIRNPQSANRNRYCFVWLEQLVAAHLPMLFRGMKVVSSYPFRVIRDADLEIREDEAGDLLQSIEESLVRRRFGSVSQLVVTRKMPVAIRELLRENLEIEPEHVYAADGPLGMSDLLALYDLPVQELKDKPYQPRVPAAFRTGADIFAAIREQDILLHHPFDSFVPVVDFVRAAAKDPDVLAIKQTIYRVGTNSPIIEALQEAALDDKQVSCIVELKARFDEEHNIEWARALEKVGAHVVYGDINLKTHCKATMVVRREPDGIRRYVHLGTGNYNAKTSRLYTDLGLFTCDPAIGEDVTALFNSLTGYSLNRGYRKLLVSPGGIRSGLMERIEREIDHARNGKGGHIIFKMNSLTDFRSADALYRASQAGVRVDLIVRGSCVLVPGVPGLSENIRVVSIVGRFLEHHRIYYFANGGPKKSEVWLGSADMMQRNLDRRVEILFPIQDRALRKHVIQDILWTYLRDNQKSHKLLPDGRYCRLHPADGEPPFDSQAWLMTHYGHEDDPRLAEGIPPLLTRMSG
jgi:polyphosphate kinase